MAGTAEVIGAAEVVGAAVIADTVTEMAGTETEVAGGACLVLLLGIMFFMPRSRSSR